MVLGSGEGNYHCSGVIKRQDMKTVSGEISLTAAFVFFFLFFFFQISCVPL